MQNRIVSLCFAGRRCEEWREVATRPFGREGTDDEHSSARRRAGSGSARGRPAPCSPPRAASTPLHPEQRMRRHENAV